MMLLPRLGQWVIRRGRINPLKIQTMGYSSSAAEQSKLSTESSHANTPQGSLHIDGRTYPRDAKTNAPPAILAKTTARLHLRPHSPLHILKEKIQEYFQSADFPKGTYSVHDALHPVATTVANFDDLRIPADHPGRSHSDTYYINSTHVLRTHTSAHQSTLLKSKASSGYLVTADVYRRDEIDSCHYPVFHQMEGVRLFKRDQNKDLTEELENNKPQTNGASKKSLAMTVQDVEILSPNNTFQETHSSMEQTLVMMHLKSHLQELMASLFSADPKLEMRWIEGSFPFTQPSWELEVFYQGKWLEVCGCGIIHQDILKATGNDDCVGWAFGLGLERIAMVLFDIPDIRLFWSSDPRFLSQFTPGKLSKFVPFSKYPPCYKDISFWCDAAFHDNDFAEVVREVAGDLVESVTLIDTFIHPKTKKTSKCYRVTYRSMERTLANDEVDQIQDSVRETVESQWKVELR